MMKESAAINRPRNYLVTDATQPFEFAWLQYGKPTEIVVQQTPNEDTWPGGALWDIGVLLSQVMVGMAAGTAPSISSQSINLPKRLFDAVDSTNNNNKAEWTVLELGCGVGLTGLAAAAALGTQLTILTDIEVVIDQVALPNLISSSTEVKQKPYRLMNAGKRGRVMALPLCWGMEEDETLVAKTFQENTKRALKTRATKKGKKKRGQAQHTNTNSYENVEDTSKPNLIIIGDVAYQHKPGAPSHFDALLSTLLKFLGPQTLVVFGTRMRMPASVDLLDMFSTYMEECCEHIPADEIDPSFSNFKHQITVHVFRKRRDAIES
jgi:predicted nicotinamide N-methyase